MIIFYLIPEQDVFIYWNGMNLRNALLKPRCENYYRWGEYSVPKRLSFQVPLVCRQLYHVAALLPYARLRFIFTEGSMRRWVCNRLPVQLAAVREVSPSAQWTEDVWTESQRPFSDIFPGLKRVVVDQKELFNLIRDPFKPETDRMLKGMISNALARREKKGLEIVFTEYIETWPIFAFENGFTYSR